MSEHAAWGWSECVGGAVDRRRVSAHRRRRRACKGGQEKEPRGGLPDLQSSPVFRPQMFLQNALGDLNSQANLRCSWSLLPPQVQAPAKTSAVCCLADALALPWAHHCSTSASLIPFIFPFYNFNFSISCFNFFPFTIFGVFPYFSWPSVILYIFITLYTFLLFFFLFIFHFLFLFSTPQWLLCKTY